MQKIATQYIKQRKTLISLCIITALGLVGCVEKKAEPTAQEKPQAATSASAPTQAVKSEVIPAMLAKSIKLNLPQPRICHVEKDLNETVCTSTEVIGLKSNIAWIDQIIDQEIQQDYAANLSQASAEQKTFNQTEVEGLRNWSSSTSYRFQGQFGQFVQVAKTSSEYMGGAHGMAYFSSYVFDLKNKKRVQLKDIVVTGQQDKLKEKLWQAYEYWCKDHDMQPFIKKEEFKTSDNFSFNQMGGLTFEYQLYELAPYVYGPISLDLNETDGLIKTDFLPVVPTFSQEY